MATLRFFSQKIEEKGKRNTGQGKSEQPVYEVLQGIDSGIRKYTFSSYIELQAKKLA